MRTTPPSTSEAPKLQTPLKDVPKRMPKKHESPMAMLKFEEKEKIGQPAPRPKHGRANAFAKAADETFEGPAA